MQGITSSLTPLLSLLQFSMTNVISLSKNVHYLKLSAKPDGVINLKLVQAHIKLIERKFRVR